MEDMIIASSSSREAISAAPPSVSSPKKAAGGWRSIKYILGNESFEKLASMGLIANLTVYLQTQYNMDGILVVNVFNVWSGSSNLTPLAGAFLSDAYLGRFCTLLYGSISSFLGMVIITLTAGVHDLRPVSCHGETNCEQPHSWQLAILFVGLALLAIGAGGIRPCNIAFGADQFDTRTESGRAQLASFFNWWYFSFTVALIIALTVVVYVQTNVSWVVGYAIPAACLFFSISVFLIGRNTYMIKKAQGSVFVDIFKVIVAALKKRSLELASGHSLYDPSMVEWDQQESKLDHTDKFKFFDKAAILADPSELNENGMPRNSWRLCSVHQVEQLKLLLGVVPVWFTGICCFITMDQMSTFGLMQAIQSNNSIGNFKIPPGWMGLSSMIALSIWIFIYEKIYLVQANKSSKKDKRLTMRQRINIGIIMAILCMLVAAGVEKKRRDLALKNGSLVSPMHILVLIPQFALSGLNEAFTAVAVMEFFSTHLPESMRTIAGAIFFLSLSAASYLNTALVNLVHHLTGRNGKSPWLGGHDLNKIRVENYYYLTAGLAALNLLYFNLFSYRYVKNNADVTESSRQEENDLEKKATA
ncbi:hypothetical protein P3X46_004922 [Hevea brasiliensis]|uniref:Uncharacterized protein n=1 Tax=Hevea brasiliensis TaxID=3981 RepID=A0ABQ9MZ21_HEVBR|nr:protein NRT1/ PTR FAMILY 2.8 [Hevea brasiliensis]KAJ9185268.1 hypothetical protein P3X46_004922 [Hevea brasiliensis]